MPGSYKAVNGSSPCLPCAPGTFSAEAGKISACSSLCAKGTYSEAGASQCSLCPHGSSSQREGSLLHNCTCKTGYAPKLVEAAQWVSSVVGFSSQNDGFLSSSAAVIGPPDADPSSSGLSTSSWMANSSAGVPKTVEWLEVNITHPVAVAEIQIFERNAPGACTRIMLMDASGKLVTAWEGRAFQQAGSRIFAPPIMTTANKTATLRLEFNMSNFTSMYQVRYSKYVICFDESQLVF